MVMELIEGETLFDRLRKGALPLDQALKHGRDVADALDKAHRAGIVHRDLKPGNIMLALVVNALPLCPVVSLASRRTGLGSIKLFNVVAFPLSWSPVVLEKSGNKTPAVALPASRSPKIRTRKVVSRSLMTSPPMR